MKKVATNSWGSFLMVVLLVGCTRDWSQYKSRDEGGTGGGISGVSGGMAGTGDGSGGVGDRYCQSPGAVEQCVCRDGTSGTRICLASGFFGDCNCPDGSECVPNLTMACVCDDGRNGVRTCLEDGFWGECVCGGRDSEPYPVCGNDMIEGAEECDGINLDGQTCGTLGEGSGTLSCTGSCTFDLSMCSGTGCGNGFIEIGEQCDGRNLGGETCSSLGLGSGTLSCVPLMCVFDVSMCYQDTGGSSGGYTAGSGGSGDFICEDTCSDAYDGFCDDGGPGSQYFICEYGTDCGDCGPRPR
jgi:hypothetical protein